MSAIDNPSELDGNSGPIRGVRIVLWSMEHTGLLMLFPLVVEVGGGGGGGGVDVDLVDAISIAGAALFVLGYGG